MAQLALQNFDFDHLRHFVPLGAFQIGSCDREREKNLSQQLLFGMGLYLGRLAGDRIYHILSILPLSSYSTFHAALQATLPQERAVSRVQPSVSSVPK